jgi:hypothetical protein
MPFQFGVQKLPIYGTSGEFKVPSSRVPGSPRRVTAQYVLTKIRPGQQGLWENQLASQMAPWREVFKTEELSFDELIQRDLDDSRVAHDLIPYLLGEVGHNARFFPPILVALVPRKQGQTGISPTYPAPHDEADRKHFGNLFDVGPISINGQRSPLAQLNYNPQQTAMIIVDGQHRAMAVLALHRQLNKSWGADPFAPYYGHIQVTPESVAHIELPVCIMYFPELHAGATEFSDAGITLTSVCREIFVVVNRQAREVSKSRELLLDDEDIAAFLMRRTLSMFKGRGVDDLGARIFELAFGDAEADTGSQVASGQLQICTAVALHKMHGAASFGLPACYSFNKPADVTDGRNTRNPVRPMELLIGAEVPPWGSLSRRSAKNHSPKDLDKAVEVLGALTEAIVIPFFDELRPYRAHHEALREHHVALSDPNAAADPVQSKCKTLLFDGSGTRHTFDEHAGRLLERKKDLTDRGQPVPPFLTSQLTYCDAVRKALGEHEDAIRLKRAFKLFNIDPVAFRNREKEVVESESKLVRTRGRAISDAVFTQAFQLGYLMAVLSTVERLVEPGTTWQDRLSCTHFVSRLFLAGTNSFFATSATVHKSLSGYVTETRSRAFEASEQGFRGLLAAGGVRELNEKQWEFFRWVVLEIVHGRGATSAVKAVLTDTQYGEWPARYVEELHSIVEPMLDMRTRYFDSAVRFALSQAVFTRELDLLRAANEAAKMPAMDVQADEDARKAAKEKEIRDLAADHLKASLGNYDKKPAKFLERISALLPADDDDAEDDDDDDDDLPATTDDSPAADDA